jgi:hypothetical protein
MLSPREIVDTMRAKNCVATSDDVSKLRDPLSQALTSLSDLTGHMDSFLLASQRLTRSGQGKTDYKYFELFLETVSAELIQERVGLPAGDARSQWRGFPSTMRHGSKAMFGKFQQAPVHQRKSRQQ